jgi:serine/threonine protein kinase
MGVRVREHEGAVMSLTPGVRLGPYEIVALVGSGGMGMGEVYRARDMRLSRNVAVKVLPRGRVGGSERLQRFEQEARAAAALNHTSVRRRRQRIRRARQAMTVG